MAAVQNLYITSQQGLEPEPPTHTSAVSLTISALYPQQTFKVQHQNTTVTKPKNKTVTDISVSFTLLQ